MLITGIHGRSLSVDSLLDEGDEDGYEVKYLLRISSECGIVTGNPKLMTSGTKRLRR